MYIVNISEQTHQHVSLLLYILETCCRRT